MFLEERESGKAWRLHQDRVYKLGRNPDQDIRFDLAHVSRLHAELFWDGKVWRLRDCDSVHGTYIQEQPIQEQQIHPHQWFRLGQESGVMLRLLPQLSSAEVATAEVYYPKPPGADPFSWQSFEGHPEMRSQLLDYANLVLDANISQAVQGILLLGGKGRGIRFLSRCLAERLSQEREQEFNLISQDLGDANNLYQASKLIYKCLKKGSKNSPAVILLQNFDIFYRYLETTQDLDQTNTGQTTWWNRFWGKLGIADLASETEKARKLKEKLSNDLETYWQWNSNPKHEQKKIIILATAGNLAQMPESVQQPGEVFSFVLPVPQATLAGKVAVLNKYLHQTGSAIDNKLNLTVLAEKFGRVNSHVLEQAVKGAEELRYKSGESCLQWQHFEPFLPKSSATIWQSIFINQEILQPIQQWAASLREWELSQPELSEVPTGMILTGASGTGKTTIVQLFAQDANCELISVTPGKIKSPLVGQSVQNLQEIFRDAKANAPALILFDEIEAILPRREEQLGDPTTVEVVNQFLQEFDRLSQSTGVVIVGTSNRPEQIDPAVLSRLTARINVPLPTVQQRSQMLEYFLTKSQTPSLELAADVDLDYYAQLLIGKSGRDIQAIATRIISQLPDSSLTLRRVDLDAVLIPKITGELTGVILPERLTSELTRTLAQFLQAFANPQLTPPAGLLLSGLPGTGKTEIARAMARLGGIQFQEVSAGEVRDKYVGESNRKLARIFAQARRNAPTILFFDELDGLFPQRGEHSVQHEIELVNQFLQEVDGVNNSGRGIFIVGATNRVEQVDAAVRSRLSKTIAIPLPAITERVAMLKLFVGERPVADDFDWEAVALLLTGKSGRAIKAKVEETYHLACQDHPDAMGEITLKHFQQAILWTGDSTNIPDLVLPKAIMERVEQTLSTLKNLPQALSLGLPLPKGMLLTGPPGTGKTQIARYLSARTGWFFRAISPSEVKSTFQGGSLKNLQSIFNDARDRSPCILFFDEIDSLFPRREGTGNNPDVELVNEFLQQVDGAAKSAAGVFLLGATNRGDTVDPAVISRLQQTLEVPLPGVRERRIMLEHALKERNWQLNPDVDLEAISRLLEGKSGRDIQGLLAKVGQAYIQRTGWSSKEVVLTRTDFEKGLLPPVEIDKSAWSKLILSRELKQILQTILRRFLRFFRDPIEGVTPSQGMLLYGAPGTGKTQVARVLAQAAGCSFISLSIAEMRSQYVGESSKKLAQTFERARREAPTILFIDEIDALFPQRESNVSQYEIELINQLLQELDGFKGSATGVFVVGATNYVERVDNAVRSRLNKVVEIPLPAQPERVDLLKLFAGEMQVAPDVDWSRIARLLEGKSGRDIRQIVSEVGQHASDRLLPDQSLTINLEHFLTVIQSKAPQGELTWDDIILPTPITEELKRLVKLVANYANLPPGINPPKGALLYGEPGTGKTQIARVLASVGQLYFKSYAPADIRSKWVGQSSRNLADVFNQARQQSPAILFFDEMESLFPNRGGMGSGDADLENQNLVNQFLQEVDGVSTHGGYIFVLGATNFAENIDAAVRSRLQKKIAIPLPGIAEIKQMLERKIHPDWILADDVDLSAYTTLLIGRSGRDIATGVETAAQLAFDEWTEGNLVLCDRHFKQGFELADFVY
ncbi:MAG: AAA family ATPase [Cyanobacteria bacterium P01_G01_bin.39]